MTKQRTRRHNTRLAFHLRRLHLSLNQAARLTRAPIGNLKNWKQGRARTPRPVLRLLAAWRLLHWGQF